MKFEQAPAGRYVYSLSYNETTAELAGKYGHLKIRAICVIRVISDSDKTDVNNDGRVDLKDFTEVCAGSESEFRRPYACHRKMPILPFTAQEVRQWIQDAKAQGIDAEGIAALEQLLSVILQQAETPPKETALLANYPNPFNPETWIPYQLAKPAEVTVSIHYSRWQTCSDISIGTIARWCVSRTRIAQSIGMAKMSRESRWQAVSYFYTLKAGDFSATKKMLIRK